MPPPCFTRGGSSTKGEGEFFDDLYSCYHAVIYPYAYKYPAVLRPHRESLRNSHWAYLICALPLLPGHCPRARWYLRSVRLALPTAPRAGFRSIWRLSPLGHNLHQSVTRKRPPLTRLMYEYTYAQNTFYGLSSFKVPFCSTFNFIAAAVDSKTNDPLSFAGASNINLMNVSGRWCGLG